jgi:hypothetical protein
MAVIKVTADNLKVECLCGGENLVILEGDINSEVALSCSGCGRGILIQVTVVVDDSGAQWIN